MARLVATALASLVLVASGNAIEDDTCSLMQAHTEWLSPSNLDSPPVPLAKIDSQKVVPALGGADTILTETLGMRVWKVEDGKLRNFRSTDKSGNYLYGTKAMEDTKRGRTILYSANDGKRLGVIWMGAAHAAVRRNRALNALPQLRDRVLPITYFVHSYRPVCAGQAVVADDSEDEEVAGENLYRFAKVQKWPMQDKYTVKRYTCDPDSPHLEGKWSTAYTLAHHGMQSALEAVQPGVGVVGTIDTEMADGIDIKRRHNTWLTAGEDPALFAAAVMVTQMSGQTEPVMVKAGEEDLDQDEEVAQPQ